MELRGSASPAFSFLAYENIPAKAPFCSRGPSGELPSQLAGITAKFRSKYFAQESFLFGYFVGKVGSVIQLQDAKTFMKDKYIFATTFVPTKSQLGTFNRF